jgi:Flp pilus assembly protein TadG
MASASARFLRDGRGSSAVEFALISPVLILIFAGIIGYGYVFSVYHGVQQIASEAARAAVAGLDRAERSRIARDFVSAHGSSYAFIDPARLSVDTREGSGSPDTFEVRIAYDMSGSVIEQIGHLVALPQPQISRSAVIQRGGY